MTNKKLIRFTLVLVVGLGFNLGCRRAEPELPQTSTEVLLRVQWAGANRLASDTNADLLSSIWQLPESQQFKARVLQKLAKVPLRLLQDWTASATNDFAELIQPLLDDLVRAESYVEMGGGTNDRLTFVLASQLNDDRMRVWSTNLSTVLEGWTGARAVVLKVGELDGWEVRKPEDTNAVRFIHAGQWTVLSCGQSALALETQVLKNIRQHGTPSVSTNAVWLDAFVDWPRFLPQGPPSAAVEWPRVWLTLTGKDGCVRTKAELVFSRPLEFSFEPWHISTNLVRDPLVSFTAAQGFGTRLHKLKFAQDLKIDPPPNQFYLWALAQVPFQTFVAFSSKDPTKLLRQMAPEMTAQMNANLLQHSNAPFSSGVSLVTNQNGFAWQGLPFVAPFAQVGSDKDSDFVFAGLFPNTLRTNAPPPELLRQIVGRTNLVYYDWEITQERLLHWRYMMDLYQIVSRRPRLSTNKIAAKWFDTVGPRLGNTVTEIAVTGPDRLTLVRKSPIGFTGFELVTLANWLESQEFPSAGFPLPSPKAGQGTNELTFTRLRLWFPVSLSE